jgi:hypothetical protein
MPKTNKVATSSGGASNTSANIAVMATAKKTEIVSCDLLAERANKAPHSTTHDLSAAFSASRVNCQLGVWEPGKLLPTPSVR